MIMSEDRDKTEELLSAYIDGEVTEEQSRSIEQAVAKDPELALELHELIAAKRLLTGLPRQRAPRGFVRRVMARAERKHLLGDQQAGGAFAAARWITLAVAAVVLLTAGIGIIAVNMLPTSQDPLPIADVGEGGGGPAGPGHDLNGGLLHGKAGGGRGRDDGQAGNGYATTGSGTGNGKLIVADVALDRALRNPRNASIYTDDVSNTLAVLHETFDRNDVLPLELETPARDSKAAEKTTDKAAGKAADKAAAETRNVSRGELNFYYNKKQDDQQVQIVVLATDTVIEQLNGDLDKLARGQRVSQAPGSDHYKGRSDGGYVARRAGPRGAQKKDTDPSGRDHDKEGMVIARVDDDNTGLGATSGERKAGKGDGHRAKSKVIAKGAIDQPNGKKAPAPAVVPAAPKIAKPALDPPVSGGANSVRPSDVAGADASVAAKPSPKQPGKGVSKTGTEGAANAPVTVVGGTGGQKYELADKGGAPKPGPAKRSVTGPTTRPAESMQLAGRIQKDILDNKDSGELEALSSLIAKQQKRGESDEKLKKEYSKLNNAFRQRIWNDDVRRNVQSQQEQGVNIQALVININRRSLRGRKTAATQSGIMLRDAKALSRPRAATTSSPVSESTTQRAARQRADTSR